MSADIPRQRRGRAPRALLFFAPLLLAACSGGGGGGGGGGAGPAPQDVAPATPPPPPTPFEVVRAEPPHGATVGQLTELRLTFSTAIDSASVVHDPSSFSGGNLRVYIQAPGASTSTRLGGAVVITGNELVFQPANPVASGSALTLTLARGITDQAGTPLGSGSVSGPLDLLSQTPDIVFQSGVAVQAPAAFEVIQAAPAHGATISSRTVVSLTFSAAVERSSVVQDATSFDGGNLRVYAQNAASTKLFRVPVSVLINQSSIVLTPLAPLSQGDTIFVTLTGAITDALGTPLTGGSVSGRLDLLAQTPDIVFLLGYGVGAPPAIGQIPEDVSGAYETFPGTDRWHIDFEVYTDPYSFASSLFGHGLGTSAPSEAALWVRHRVIASTLATSSVLYGRNDDGSPVSGTAYRVSFASNAPPGQVAVDYSRMGVGGPSDIGALGAAASLDFGNANREDNIQPGVLGVSASDIFGDNSVLLPALSAADLPFVDGSYVLGAGTSADDARFLTIRDVIDNYGFALGFVNAHEVGHLVGLDHDTSNDLNIMFPAAVSLSDPRTRFSAASAATLDRNLGREP